MTSDSVPTGGDVRRVLGDLQGLALRVRVAQRVTWLPLLVFGVVTFLAVPAQRFGWREEHCTAVSADQQLCHVRLWGAMAYWTVAVLVAYAVIAVGYARAARARGVGGGRVRPYVITGAVLAVLPAAFFLLFDPGPDPAWSVIILGHLLEPVGAIGLALLVLAWLERHVALLAFTLGYLVVALARLRFGWGEHWGDQWGFAPPLVFSGGMLLLGALCFGLSRRWGR
jgi:hypothetical protein